MTAPQRPGRQAFTLIELLVVVAIIAILASLTFAAVSKAVLTSKRNVAGTEARAVALAIEKFYKDYGYLPTDKNDQGFSPGSASNLSDYEEQDQKYFTEAESKKIIRILMGDEDVPDNQKLNPRETVYLDLNTPTSDGTLEDPWGRQYIIKLDRDYDGKVEYYSLPIQHTVRAVVASAGPSGWRSASGGLEPVQPRDLIANVTLPNATN